MKRQPPWKKGNSLSEQKDDISKWGKPLVFQKLGGFGIKNQINWLWLWCSFIIRPTCSIWKGNETFSMRRKIKNMIRCEFDPKIKHRHVIFSYWEIFLNLGSRFINWNGWNSLFWELGTSIYLFTNFLLRWRNDCCTAEAKVEKRKNLNRIYD